MFKNNCILLYKYICGKKPKKLKYKIRAMIEFTGNNDAPLYQGYFIAVAMYVVAVVQAICLQQYFHKCYVVGMQIRTSLVTIIYDKVCYKKKYVQV